MERLLLAHPLLLHLVGWLVLSGTGRHPPDPAAPGFKKIIIMPAIVGDLTWVKAHHDSPYGRIVSNWQRDGRRLTMDITIPANTTATVFVPGESIRQVGPGPINSTPHSVKNPSNNGTHQP